MNGTAIATEGLTHRFGKLTAVDDLHLEVPAGTVCGFLGRNGAGKTTTIQILMNLLRPTAGTTEVLGLDPAADSLALRRQVGYVAENRVMYGWMKVREIVWFTGQFYETWNQARVDGLISRFGLDPEQKVKHLSRGMNAQLALALALGHEPRLLILDEPASGLDVVVRRDFPGEHHRSHPGGGAHGLPVLASRPRGGARCRPRGYYRKRPSCGRRDRGRCEGVGQTRRCEHAGRRG